MSYQKTYYAKRFILKNAVTGLPIDVSAYALRSQFRQTTASTTVLLDLTTANGGWAIVDGPNGIMELRITSLQFDSLPVGTVVFDLMRTDLTPGPRRLFGCKMKVKQPVTRI